MALKLLQSGGNPLGQFDADDRDTFLGGEVITFTARAVGAATDKSAADSADGYYNPGTSRAVLTKVLSNALGAGAVGGGPLMLADDGTSGYGTLFGQVVGGTVGQQVTGGAQLGPATNVGSGKVTAWHQPGLYGVTLDAVDTATIAPSVASCTPGKPLYALNATGFLTTNNSTGVSFNNGTTSIVVGNFVEFATDGSLVRTPNRLVAALNSPSSNVSSSLATSYTMAIFHFNPGK